MLRHFRLPAPIGFILASVAGVSLTLAQGIDPLPPLEFRPDPIAEQSPSSDLEAQLATAKAQQDAAVQRTNELTAAIAEQDAELKEFRADLSPLQPYSFTQLEQLRDQFALEESRSEMLETALAAQQEALEQGKAAFEVKERSRRQAKAAIELGTSDEANPATPLALAELESELAGAHLAMCRASLEHAKLELKLHELRLTYLKEKITRATQHVTLSEADRAAPLDLLRKQEDNLKRTRDSIQADIAFRQQDWFAVRQKLTASQTPDPALTEQEKAYRLALQTQKQRLATVDQRLTRIAGVKKAWDRRFQLNDKQTDHTILKDWRQETAATIAQLEREIRGEISRMADVRRQIATLEEEIEAGKNDPPEAIQWRNEQLAQLEKLARTHQRELDNLDNSRRLYDKLRADITARGLKTPLDERLAEVWSTVVTWWYRELFSIDDQRVTPHQIAKGIILFLVGAWLSRRATNLFGRRLVNRFGVHPSGAAAIQSVVFYVLLCLFVLLALRTASIPLTALTILGGAVALGVGFGSQNIINNFISGLILLAERPIRVGDMIEIDGLHATVDKIGARSTRVVTGSNLEIIVPNSKFLENNVVNWTLSDDRMRTFVSVGVEYGSAVDKVTTLLHQIAAGSIHVLPESESIVLFKDFGDNALIFELHFWISARNNFGRRRIESEMRYHIHDAFAQAGIEIAFPQSQVHLQSARPIEVRMVGEYSAPSGNGNGAATTAANRR